MRFDVPTAIDILSVAVPAFCAGYSDDVFVTTLCPGITALNSFIVFWRRDI